MTTKAPAVTAAIAILRFLRGAPAPATLAEIARAVRVNTSTCFNILQVLQQERFVVRDGETKRYRLGPALLELGLGAARDSDVRAVAVPLLQRLVQEIGLGCVLVERAWDEHFVVVDSIESPSDVRVSVAIGTRFPPNVPAIARAYLAWRPADEVERFLVRWGVPHYTTQANDDLATFWQQLAAVRAQGYAVSRGEYRERYRSLAAPVFDYRGEPVLVATVIGFASDLADPLLPHYGKALARAVAAITAAIGGQPPPEPDHAAAGLARAGEGSARRESVA